jgi:hypothetical protein
MMMMMMMVVIIMSLDDNSGLVRNTRFIIFGYNKNEVTISAMLCGILPSDFL